MNYSDKLKDPRWQMKRASIKIRDNFTCQYCFAVEKQEPGTGRMLVWLEVHHFEYPPYGAPPWEAEDVDLVTLCMTCHSSVMKSEDRIRKITGDREKQRMERRDLLRRTPDPVIDFVFMEQLQIQEHERRLALASDCTCESCRSEGENR